MTQETNPGESNPSESPEQTTVDPVVPEPVTPPPATEVPVLETPAAPGKFSRLFSVLKTPLGWLKEGLVGIRSKDGPTRMASALLYLVLVAIVLFGLNLSKIQKEKKLSHSVHGAEGSHSQEGVESIESVEVFLREKSEFNASEFYFQNLGSFNIDLKSESGSVKSGARFQSVQIELAARCASKEVCDKIKLAEVRLREKIIQSILRVQRQDLMSRDGKIRIRDQIKSILEEETESKKIIDVYITKLVLPNQ